MKLASALHIALVFVLLLVVPVSATPPDIVTGEFELNYAPFDPSPCSFEVMDREVMRFRQTTYYDSQGNVTRIKIHFNGTDNFYNPANPDVVLSGSFAATTEIDLETGELVNVSGTPLHVTAPGYGTVLMRAGRWVLYPDGQIAGKNSFEDPEDIEQFCSLLAGG